MIKFLRFDNIGLDDGREKSIEPIKIFICIKLTESTIISRVHENIDIRYNLNFLNTFLTCHNLNAFWSIYTCVCSHIPYIVDIKEECVFGVVWKDPACFEPRFSNIWHEIGRENRWDTCSDQHNPQPHARYLNCSIHQQRQQELSHLLLTLRS